MTTIVTGTTVTLHNGRKTTVTPRTYNTSTGWIVWLTQAEARTMRLPRYSAQRYSYSVDLQGQVERWINGYGGVIAKVTAPVVNT